MVIGMIAGALIALIFFVLGFAVCYWIRDTYEVDSESETKASTVVTSTSDTANTADIFRIKHGPKAGLLSYKKAREA